MEEEVQKAVSGYSWVMGRPGWREILSLGLLMDSGPPPSRSVTWADSIQLLCVAPSPPECTEPHVNHSSRYVQSVLRMCVSPKFHSGRAESHLSKRLSSLIMVTGLHGTFAGSINTARAGGTLSLPLSLFFGAIFSGHDCQVQNQPELMENACLQEQPSSTGSSSLVPHLG